MHAQHADFEHRTGERFHFIARYLAKVVPGTPFVYYRGVRRAGGGFRTHAEYFGCGSVGEVWEDELSRGAGVRRFYCRIEDYLLFPKAVPARIEGHWLEPISHPLGFQPSVRTISMELYREIAERGGMKPRRTSFGTAFLPSLPEIADLQPRVAHDLWALSRSKDQQGAGLGSVRNSAHAAAVGERAEHIVVRHLRETLPPKQARAVEWVARRRLGWDIEYEDDGQRVVVEVKATVRDYFDNVELTAREWAAAERFRERFWLYLVADCFGSSPMIQPVRDPFGLVAEAGWRLIPLTWRFGPPGPAL